MYFSGLLTAIILSIYSIEKIVEMGLIVLPLKMAVRNNLVLITVIQLVLERQEQQV